MDNYVSVEQGQLMGEIGTDLKGTPFLSFMGIPYAKPPIGQLRFKAPQPSENWEGIRDATKQGSPCYAPHFIPTEKGFSIKLMGSEDCLFLNVFTPQLPLNSHDLKPVMVFIHGGGFVLGSSDRSMFGPEFLMTEGVVLVTLNYRLGALGFLVIDDPALEVTGNAGLKDQIQALKWIQKNIKQFGGDPNNVTIFGQSAGGASVHYLLLSPLGKGLFHKAIMQSGTSLCPWARGINNTQQLAEDLGCTSTDPEEILEFLQQQPVELISAQNMPNNGLCPSIKRLFSPSVEAKVNNAFLSEEPLDLMKSGNYSQVPIMIGYTSREGIFEAHGKDFGFGGNYEDFVPYYFGYPRGSKKFKEVNEEITKFYFGTDKPDLSQIEQFYEVFSDAIFIRDIFLTVKIHMETCQEPIYFYRMSLDARLNGLKKLMKSKNKGVCHCDDLGYLFKNQNTDYQTDLQPGSIEEVSVLRFVRMWANFARSGTPTLDQDSLLNTEWKPVDKDVLNFLDIGAELVPGVGPDIERMDFWDKISEGIEYRY